MQFDILVRGYQRDHREIQIGGAKQRPCCAFSSIRGELFPTDMLVEEIWAAPPPATAVKTVQVYVSQLRKALGEGAVATAPGWVRPTGPSAAPVDADRFEDLIAKRHHRHLAEGDAQQADAGAP